MGPQDLWPVSSLVKDSGHCGLGGSHGYLLKPWTRLLCFPGRMGNTAALAEATPVRATAGSLQPPLPTLMFSKVLGNGKHPLFRKKKRRWRTGGGDCDTR